VVVGAASPAVAPPAPARVVALQPEGPADAPRGLPPDFAAFGSPAGLVVAIPTDLRDGPGRRYRRVRRLEAGERLVIDGRAGDWYRLESGEGWAFAAYLERETAAETGSFLAVVQDVTVPVHEGPGGQHAVVAELYRGQRVVLDELRDEWAHVRNGGWVRRSTLGAMTPGKEND
jgi:uncharacterized protein YraI